MWDSNTKRGVHVHTRVQCTIISTVAMTLHVLFLLPAMDAWVGKLIFMTLIVGRGMYYQA